MMPDTPKALRAAVAAIHARRLDEAETAVTAVLEQDEQNAQALQLAGIIAMMQQRPEQAVRHFTRAVECDPGMAAAFSNLGLAKLDVGFGDEALLDCRRAVELKPGDAELAFNLAVVLEAGGRLREAARGYRRVLELNASHAKAMLNLGSVLHRLGDHEAAQEVFKEGKRRFDSMGDFARNLGHALLALGQLAPAAEAFIEALTLAADDDDARAGLAATLRRQGRLEEAAALCSREPGTGAAPDLCRQLGMIRLEQGRLADAIHAFEQGVAIKRRPGELSVIANDQLETSAAKLRHDLEQLKWLRQRNMLEDTWAGAEDACRKVLDSLPADIPPASVFNLSFTARRRIQGFYNRIIRRGSQAEIAGGAVNPGLDPAGIEQDYCANAPGMTVVDDFLRPAALSGLRRFCLESTFWFDFYHPNGYLGAYLEEGFQCPLLLQIVADLRRLMPEVIADLPLRQMWAYKYDSELDGIEMHADFAAVNVNFWITPDEANLDKESGGMIVWDKAAPEQWDFDDYNSSEAGEQQRIRDFLAESGARPRTIPYRENRAVIFNSDLFHKTDRIRFAPGYSNRRINITMLFGTRGQR